MDIEMDLKAVWSPPSMNRLNSGFTSGGPNALVGESSSDSGAIGEGSF